MNSTESLKTRNQSMEIAKLVASFFVVFIHVHFPGRAGALIDYLGQFAVPMFFGITGYFNYGAKPEDVVRRAKHIFALYISGNAVQALYLLFEALYRGQGIKEYIFRLLPDQEGLTRWIVVQSEFIAGHLWYLHALLVVYLLYWMYLSFYRGEEVNYKPLCTVGFVTLAIYFTLRVVAVVYVEDMTDITRNAYLTGIPMFCLGLFLHAYQEQIFSSGHLNNKTLIAVVAVGELMTLQQWVAGVGDGGTAFGTFLAAIALLLLLVHTPTVAQSPQAGRLLRKCGSWSMYIYLYHLTVGELLTLLLGSSEGKEQVGG